ncbi:O-antigen ligase family protein [Sphingomonas canadensis]|uniref:O-antigen ligase family protein n=1 Tax=Sphingomonas canadensis TaxID=1219257 RepID=A0ABW3H5K7_9SPHN|nr:O-antigen ligase family protein [Sphingomonas canadensis]MCW3835403.1 O-antigen ligase family protein [Sphingomonas canadensis]
MNGPLAQLFARLSGDVQRPPRLMYALLIVTILAFTAANSFGSAFSRAMTLGKWAPLAALTVVSIITFFRLRTHPKAPALASIMIGALALLTASSAISSRSPTVFLNALTVFGTIAAGYSISAVLVATNSRMAYYQLIANLCRIIVLSTLPFYILNIDLGRGGGAMGLNAWTDNANTLATILAPGTVVFVAGCLARGEGWQYKHLPFLMISLGLIWVTGSRATVVWMILSVGAFWIYRRGLALNTLLVLGFAMILTIWWQPIMAYLGDALGLTSESLRRRTSVLSGREEVWRYGWSLFERRPFEGYGLGTSEEILTAAKWRFVRHQGGHFHSSYLTVLVELGLWGLVTFVLGLGATIVQALRDSRRTQNLSNEAWVYSALPFALMMGALGHAGFETWVLSAGNVNTLNFWTWFWLIHHQTQVKVRAKPQLLLPAPNASQRLRPAA